MARSVLSLHCMAFLSRPRTARLTNRNIATPEIHYSHPHKTVYKPDLQILKRPTQSPSPTPSTQALSKQEEEALRIEREKRYEEVRGRIFGSASPTPGVSGTTGGASKARDSKGRKEMKEEMGKGMETGKGMAVPPLRGPKGPIDGKGFASGRERGRER